ncbi:MAG: heavy metal translocating P-type ATPase [Anaerolineae bacterium]
MQTQMIEVPIQGMDCHECTQHVQRAIANLPGVDAVEVFLTSEKARIHCDPSLVQIELIAAAVSSAGYAIGDSLALGNAPTRTNRFTQAEQQGRKALFAVGAITGIVLLVVVIGEWLGVFEQLTARVPLLLGIAGVILAGTPIFRNALRALRHGQITSHLMMSIGALFALLVGEWATAGVVVFLMHVGSSVERFTANQSRRAVKELADLAPQTAHVERNGVETDLPLSQVRIGDAVIVRPGERIPVDGIVVDGQATVDQAAITGESMPVEVSNGAKVYAATIAQLGHLKICASAIGLDTTFGRIVRLVEDAESNKAEVQRAADKFAGYYLPFVLLVGFVTLALSGNPLSAAAVLVIACSCSFALATPIAMVASIGMAARQGILIKGGKYLELLAKADVVLIDKTGTLTPGKPIITDVAPFGIPHNDLLRLAASAERYSEHPLARAVREYAQAQAVSPSLPETFTSIPGQGVRVTLDGTEITVGRRRLFHHLPPEATEYAARFEAQGKTVLFVAQDGRIIGMLAAADITRAEVPQALTELRKFGVTHLELITGDNRHAAEALCGPLGLPYQAELLPEDKIRIVKAYQERGHTVVMIGDGVNDAPALAQADVGIAMGGSGTDIAIEAAHLTLMRDNWMLIPAAFHLAHRAMRVVRLNLSFTAVYNLIGVSLAAFGVIPPALAAAAQSIPDLGIVGNSARLLRQNSPYPKDK